MKKICIILFLALTEMQVVLSASEIRSDLYMGEKSDQIFGNVYPDIVMRSGNCTLNVYYIDKGSPYEGYHGILFEQGKEIVSGNTNKYFKNFEIKYYGSYEGRQFSNDKTGWLPINTAYLPRNLSK